MSISEYTKSACKALCAERAVENEVSRLNGKAELMRRKGYARWSEASNEEVSVDHDNRMMSERYYRAAVERLDDPKPSEPSGAPSRPEPDDNRQQLRIKKAEVERRARQLFLGIDDTPQLRVMGVRDE